MGRVKELVMEQEKNDNIDELAEIIAEAEGISKEEVLKRNKDSVFEPYVHGQDLQSVHARINNNTVFVSNIDNRSGTHMSLIQNLIAHEVVRLYKSLDKIEEEHVISPEIMSKLRESVKITEELAGKIAKAVQVNLRKETKRE